LARSSGFMTRALPVRGTCGKHYIQDVVMRPGFFARDSGHRRESSKLFMQKLHCRSANRLLCITNGVFMFLQPSSPPCAIGCGPALPPARPSLAIQNHNFMQAAGDTGFFIPATTTRPTPCARRASPPARAAAGTRGCFGINYLSSKKSSSGGRLHKKRFSQTRRRVRSLMPAA
jgi:hypothetical protein